VKYAICIPSNGTLEQAVARLLRRPAGRLSHRPAVVGFYSRRPTAEQWIKTGEEAVKLTRLSCHRFRTNEAQLALSVIAYNLGDLWRRLGLPKRIDTWSLTSLQQRLLKTGGRLIMHVEVLYAGGVWESKGELRLQKHSSTAPDRCGSRPSSRRGIG